jgi:hypothetical protein
MPDTLRGLGLITGARRGGLLDRTLLVRTCGDSGDTPLMRASGLVMPRCCCKLETNDTREAFWLSYGEAGLICKWPMPTFMRLSTLLRRESKCEPASMLSRLSPKPWLREGNGTLGWTPC